jgi:serine/threonine protein kinase
MAELHPGGWSRVREVFEAALAQPAGRRSAFVAELCGDDPATHDRVLALLGQGGMGDVYQARDTRLERTVALKVLASSAADNPAPRDRFEREARAVAALNHPHICTLYDIGSDAGVDFLVMEFLEGETLATRLLRGTSCTTSRPIGR